MKVLILSDGKAGHVSQARGVALALAQSFPVTGSVLECRLRAGFLQRPLRWLLNLTRGRLPRFLFKWLHRGGALPGEKPDLIVSAGGSTCAANAWLATLLSAPNIFCGSIRSLKPSLFAGIVTAFDPPEPHARYILCTTPVPIALADLAEKAAAWRARSGVSGPCWSLLAGGDGAGYRYTAADWLDLARALTLLARQHGIRWLITTSRRSGPDAAAALEAGMEPDLVAGAAFAGKPDGMAYHEILGAAERHFVTEDSHMMITEAIACGRPVHTLQPEQFRTDEGNLHFLRLYGQKGWITRHAISILAADGLSALPPAPAESPAILDDLGEKLAAWWSRLQADAPGLRPK